jgi:phosphate-selective porin OprO/OprP
MEGSTSSKELLTIDRSNLANNIWFTEEYFPGVTVSGEHNDWQYRASVFSSGEKNREFGKFNGSFFTLASIGRNFAKRLDARDATLRVDYVYQDPHPSNTFTESYSTSFQPTLISKTTTGEPAQTSPQRPATLDKAISGASWSCRFST